MSVIVYPLIIYDRCLAKLGRKRMARILTHEMRDERKSEKKATRKE